MSNEFEKQTVNKLKENMNLSNENIINKIILSDEFKKELERISVNYNNLKQENVIRNYILEKLNEYFIENGCNNKKAFAEHPRVKGSRVDLSIVDCNDLINPYNIELNINFQGTIKRCQSTTMSLIKILRKGIVNYLF